jgi:hypothetical protein
MRPPHRNYPGTAPHLPRRPYRKLCGTNRTLKRTFTRNPKKSPADRLKAFQRRQEGIEIIQNRIATRLGGSDGWTILMRLSDASLQRLTKLPAFLARAEERTGF